MGGGFQQSVCRGRRQCVMNRDTSVSNYDSSIQHLDATSLAEVVATRSCSLFIGCAQCGDRALRRLTPRSKETLERYYLASVHALRAQPGESILEVGCGFGNLPPSYAHCSGLTIACFCIPEEARILVRRSHGGVPECHSASLLHPCNRSGRLVHVTAAA